MPLDFTALLPRISKLISRVEASERVDLLQSACDLLRSADTAQLHRVLREREQRERIPWLVARPVEDLGAAYPCPSLPGAGWSVVASDGSFIAPDRHSPLRFFVLNLGLAWLTYGGAPDARLWSTSGFYGDEADLYVNVKGRRVPVEGARLGVRMVLEEMDALWDATRSGPAGVPLVALRDGSLILWALQSEEDVLVDHFLEPVLERLKHFEETGVPLGSYISYPGAQDVANSLRLLLCAKDPEHCGECAGASDEERALCRALADFRDQTLFWRHLQPGQRSAVFDSSSAILERYGTQRVQFFYLHCGEEIARVEAPQWVLADRTMRDFLHAVVVDQCQRGRGYPPALMEAHEQAVISTGERQLLEQMVDEALAAQGIVYTRSAKDRSKRERGL